MKLVLQIVKDAELLVDMQTISKIGEGMVAYFCVEKGDIIEDLSFFAKRISSLRIFPDKNGKTNLLGFFVGQVMKETKGRANPKTVNELIRSFLDD